MLFVSAAQARSLEAERQDAAANMLARLQSVEERAVADALANSLDVSDGSAEVTLPTEFGPLEVVVLRTRGFDDGPRVLPYSRASVEVVVDTVAEVLSSAGQESDDSLLLTVLALDEVSSSKIETDAVLGEASVLSSLALSINFWKKDGTRLDVSELEHPLSFTLDISDPATQCAFWDEDTSRWSDEGTATVVKNGTIQCTTSHLTIFGGVKDVLLRNIVLALSCSTISTLLSSDAFSKLQNTAWLAETPAILNFAFHLLGVLCVLVAWLYDRKLERVVPWRERELVLMQVKDVEEKEEEQRDSAPRPTFWTDGGEAPRPSRWSRCMACFNSSMEYVSHASGGDSAVDALKEVAGNADIAAVNRAISSIQSHKCGVARSQIRILKQARTVISDRQTITRGATLSNFVTGSEDQGEAAARAFLERGWLCRIATLWPATHPWMTATHFNMLAPVRVSVALVFLKVTSAAALSAVFFSSGSPSPDADPECSPPAGGVAKTIQSVTVGLVTAMLGDMIIAILFTFQVKRVVFAAGEWSEQQKRRQYTYWSLWSLLFWLIFFLYGGFCQLYICLFLANVTKTDAGSWLQSMGVTVLEDLVLKSLLTALILATIATAVLCCRPSLIQRVEQKWMKANEVDEHELKDEELEDKEPEDRGLEDEDLDVQSTDSDPITTHVL